MNDSEPNANKTANEIAKNFFGVEDDPESQKTAIRQFLFGAVMCAILLPTIFFLRFGEVGPLGWGTTVFFVMYCLLTALGLYYRNRPDYHSPVHPRGDWLDWLGAFWLVSCVFGPFFGWVVTSVFLITAGNWRFLYLFRVLLAVGAPFITAIPLTRYLRGKAVWVGLPLLIVVTMLPVLSAVKVSQDLWEGPVIQQVQTTDHAEYYLQYTEQRLGPVP